MDNEHPLPIVLFDGICNLCESSVQFVIRHDRQSRFRFASLQSEAGRRILDEFQYEANELSSVILVDNGELSRKSRAALNIARQLDGAWPTFYFLFFWIPPFIAPSIAPIADPARAPVNPLNMNTATDPPRHSSPALPELVHRHQSQIRRYSG